MNPNPNTNTNTKPIRRITALVLLAALLGSALALSACEVHVSYETEGESTARATDPAPEVTTDASPEVTTDKPSEVTTDASPEVTTDEPSEVTTEVTPEVSTEFSEVTTNRSEVTTEPPASTTTPPAASTTHEPSSTTREPSETLPSVPEPADPLRDGAVIYYENFNGYGTKTGNDAVFAALRQNGVWRLDDGTSPYYASSAPYAAKSTCRYAIRDGKLQILGYKDENGAKIASPADTYLVVLDENSLWELEGRDYTIEYTLEYGDCTDVARYFCVLWNYYGQYYNSFHLRVRGTGNLQGHMAGEWLDLDRSDAKDLYSDARDDETGSSIAKKLLGRDLGGSTGKTVFLGVEVTVRIRVFSDGTVSVLLRAENGDFVEVSRYHPSSELGSRLNEHTPLCNGGALAIKTGAGINGTLDDLIVYMGHGETPTDKTVTYDPPAPPPLPIPEIGFTQDRVVGNDEYAAYAAFNAVADGVLTVPGLNEEMVPQGMDVWEEKDLLLISGYFTSNVKVPSSVILAVDLKTGKHVGSYLLKNADGSYHTSHVGGVAVAERDLYLSTASALWRIPLSELTAAGDYGVLTVAETIPVPVRASFCNYSGGYLWVGDFYIADHETYDTPDWRHLKNNAGGTYGAWCVGYRLTGATESGLSLLSWSGAGEYAIPDVVLSIPDRIQGFTVSGSTVALSRSYGRTNDSSILLYGNPLGTAAHTSVNLLGQNVPVWFLDAKNQTKSYKTAPMSEGLAAYDGAILVLYESGATPYRTGGGKNPTDRVWKMKIE